ncbi:MAG TPA: biopolymer transporter ExbD [Longimicrobiales bacterium]|nr:biopolymer transporter ExbD [Longimicrobiales bacterium]
MASADVGGETAAEEEHASGVVGDINVTPMVDVMLVLLIIFMVVTPAIMAGFQATLPEGAHLKARPEEDDRTTFGVDREGAWYINKKPIRREDAEKLLAAEFLKHPDDKVLFVKADKNLKYGQMVEVMEIAKKAGAAVFAAVTDSKPGTEKNLENVAKGQ